jgi:hypothetical protein
MIAKQGKILGSTSYFIDSENYLLTCSRYIELNSVRVGMANDPAEYPWSSYHFNALHDYSLRHTHVIHNHIFYKHHSVLQIKLLVFISYKDNISVISTLNNMLFNSSLTPMLFSSLIALKN